MEFNTRLEVPRAHKKLLIERVTEEESQLDAIHEEYVQLIVPYAKSYYYTDEDYDSLSQNIKVREFSMWSHDIIVKNHILLCPYTPYQILALHILGEGCFEASIQERGEIFLEESECNLFHLHSHLHTVALNAGEKIYSFHINVTPEGLQRLALKYPLFRHLLKKQLGPIGGPLNRKPFQLTAQSALMVSKIATCKYVEVQASCYLYRCFLNMYLNFTLQDKLSVDPLILSPTGEKIIKQIFDYVSLHAPRIQHTREIATHFRVDEGILIKNFRRKFCIGLREFIVQQRLFMAYDMLVKDHLDLRTIAMKTGFSHTSAFVYAFKKYFETEPNYIRNAQ